MPLKIKSVSFHKSNVYWSNALERFDLSCDAVHLWKSSLVEVNALPEHCRSWLSDEEHSRLQNISDPERRDEYASTRIIVRYLAGAYLGVMPSAVVLQQAPNKKVLIVPPTSSILPLFTGWSHSKGILLIAFSRCETGVDIEAIRAQGLYPHLSSLLQQYLSEECGTPQQFTAYWSASEALFKAFGKGTLLGMLRSKYLQLEASDAPCGYYFDVDGTHIGALACNRPCNLSGYQFSWRSLHGMQ